MAFFVDFALFFRTIDGLLRYGTLGYGTVRTPYCIGVSFEKYKKFWAMQKKFIATLKALDSFRLERRAILQIIIAKYRCVNFPTKLLTV